MYAESVATPRSRFGGPKTVKPWLCSSDATAFQLDASAHAPCTRTTVGLGMSVSLASSERGCVRLSPDPLCFYISIECRSGNPQGPTDVCDDVALVLRKGLQLRELLRRQHLGSAEQPAPGTRRLQTSMGSLPYEVPLELSQRPEDVKDELAATGRGVDVLLKGAKAHTPLLQLPDGLDEMRQGAAEPVESPHHERVARAKVGRALGW